MTLFLCKHYDCMCFLAPPGVIPYLPYSTHCILRRRGCVTAKLLASMMAKSGREEREREREIIIMGLILIKLKQHMTYTWVRHD